MKTQVDHFLRGTCLAGALLVSCDTAFASACNKTPVQPSSVQAFGRDMVVNGVPTSLTGAEFPGTPEDVSRAFRDFWTREDVPAHGRTDSSGTMLSALDDRCLYVINIPAGQTGDRTRGLISVVQVGADPGKHLLPDAVVPLPEEGSVMSDVESRDPEQIGRTWVIGLSGDAQWNAQRYRNRLAAQGWSAIGRQPDVRSRDLRETRASAFSMQRGRDSVDVTFSERDGRTTAVINAIRNR